MSKTMTSMERVLTTMSMKEPDRVPLFLLCTHFCSKLMNLSVKDYFDKPENVVQGQLKLMKEFGNDCLNPYYSAAHEVSAFGSEIVFMDEGPPNVGEPILKSEQDILNLQPPRVKDSKILMAWLETIRLLKETVGNDVPIGGGVISPFTLPILQLGLAGYIELIYERPDLHNHLIKVNESFCIDWANMQLEAGASFVALNDAMSTSYMIPKKIYLESAYPSAKRTIGAINSDVALATSSTSASSILEEVLDSGIKAIMVSHNEDLGEVKKMINGRATILGNLNGIEMCRWGRSEAYEKTKEAIFKGAEGGGFVLSDSLGDIPYQVHEDTLHEISACIQEWGQYPVNRR